MTVLRSGPRGVVAPFGLTAFLLAVSPTPIGHQGVVPSPDPQPSATQRYRQSMIASPFGTIHAATFTLPRPIGTDMFEPTRVQLASLDVSGLFTTGAIDPAPRETKPRASLLTPRETAPVGRVVVFPTIDRSAKGDYLGTRDSSPPAQPEDDAATPGPQSPNGLDEIEAAMRFEPFPEYDISLSLELHPQIPVDEALDALASDQPDISLIEMANNPDPKPRTSRLFFGADLIGPSLVGIVPWADGEQPILMLPRAPADPEMKSAALPPQREDGETVAGKGEVTSEGQRPKSPAERLGLTEKTRDKSEKCLANAVYFESRGETVRGQIAVAQVVMNRVFSGYYPDNVCGVVYQNAYRRLACQFTFACDGIPDVVADAESWARAQRIARATLDGRVWLPEVGKATHYHASWVRPRWVREMRKLHKIGVHTFYRPRYWGDGSDAPSWGSATLSAETSARM